MAMTISVIIPTLNEERTIMATLAQTAALGFNELIVVDGGSFDQTPMLVESYRRKTRPPEQSPVRLVTTLCGRAHQMNEGARASGGEILLFLHADTQLPDGATTMIEAALADQGMVGGRFDVRFDHPSMWGAIISRMMNGRSRLSGIATGDLKQQGATAALTATVTTSFRRWEQQGPLRTILLMWGLRFLYWIGVNSHTLNRWYGLVR
jgi:glycosyltransferase involved in cell wall biosynthesis